MTMKVTPGHEAEDQDVTSYALARWDRTARLCAIRLTEALPAFAPLLWVIMRRLQGLAGPTRDSSCSRT